MVSSSMDDPNQKLNEIKAWARRVLGRIVGAADSALFSEGNGSDRELDNRSDITDYENFDAEIEKLRIRGTRTLLVEDAGRLERYKNILIDSFNKLSSEFDKCENSANEKEPLVETLGAAMNAAYYIGAYTTITDRIHEVVRPLNRREQAQLARKGKAVKNIGSEKALRSDSLREAVRYILETNLSDGKHGASLARYRLIRQRVGAAPKDTWPSKSTVERVIQQLRDEAEKKAPQS
jgi:hypothetical protein